MADQPQFEDFPEVAGDTIIGRSGPKFKQPQPSPGLESVRRLIAAIESVERLNSTPVKDRQIDGVGLMALMSCCCNAGIDALPSLRSLLSEVEQSRTLRKELDTVSGRYGEAMQEIVRLKLEIEKLREENAKLKAPGKYVQEIEIHRAGDGRL